MFCCPRYHKWHSSQLEASVYFFKWSIWFAFVVKCLCFGWSVQDNLRTLSQILFACECVEDLQSALARKRKLRKSRPRLAECIMGYFDARMPCPLSSLSHCATGRQKQVLTTWKEKQTSHIRGGWSKEHHHQTLLQHSSVIFLDIILTWTPDNNEI